MVLFGGKLWDTRGDGLLTGGSVGRGPRGGLRWDAVDRWGLGGYRPGSDGEDARRWSVPLRRCSVDDAVERGPMAKSKKKSSGPVGEVRRIAENRKARHDYEIIETFEAGLQLVGSEVKTLRGGKGNVAEAFVRFDGDEAFLVDAHIPIYAQANQFNHEPRRKRKLLLKRKELDKLMGRVQAKGLTLVPLKLYFKGAWVKLEVGLARGRKSHDKRHALKEKQDKRDIARALRGR